MEKLENITLKRRPKFSLLEQRVMEIWGRNHTCCRSPQESIFGGSLTHMAPAHVLKIILWIWTQRFHKHESSSLLLAKDDHYLEVHSKAEVTNQALRYKSHKIWERRRWRRLRDHSGSLCWVSGSSARWQAALAQMNINGQVDLIKQETFLRQQGTKNCRSWDLFNL